MTLKMALSAVIQKGVNPRAKVLR